MKNPSARKLAAAGMIGAAYAVMAIFGSVFGITYGPIQFRFSEALCVLPFLFPEAMGGLFVGCLIANIFSPYGLLDIVIGSLATLIAAWLTSRCRSRYLAPLPPVVVNAVLVGGLLAFVTLKTLLDDPASPLSQSNITGRMLTWHNRLATDDMDTSVPADSFVITDNNFQKVHARIAVARGDLHGVMPGNSEQREFLPQAYSDFIFAIIAEEMGLAGVIFVVLLYIILLIRAGRIASRCERNFPAFLIIGLTTLLLSQAMLNMMVAVGLFPVTGQTLPMISRGGTSTIITGAYFGMILSISRYARSNGRAALPNVAREDSKATEREFTKN